MGDIAEWLEDQMYYWDQYENVRESDGDAYVAPRRRTQCMFCRATGVWWKKVGGKYQLMNHDHSRHLCLTLRALEEA